MHGVTSQKIIIVIVNAARASTLTYTRGNVRKLFYSSDHKTNSTEITEGKTKICKINFASSYVSIGGK
jgi:hypothetical protein